MQMIDRIHSTDELKSFRNQVGRVIQKRLGSKLSQRKLDEFTADLLGTRDFNTAMGLAGMAESIPKGVETFRNTPKSNQNEELNRQAWHSVLKGVVWDGYASEEEVQELLDGAVDDFVGMSEWISENINNQGWERQIEAIASEMALSQLRGRLSEITGIENEDIDRCVNEAAAQISNEDDPLHAKFPFSVNMHVGY